MHSPSDRPLTRRELEIHLLRESLPEELRDVPWDEVEKRLPVRFSEETREYWGLKLEQELAKRTRDSEFGPPP